MKTVFFEDYKRENTLQSFVMESFVMKKYSDKYFPVQKKTVETQEKGFKIHSTLTKITPKQSG